MQTTTEFTLRQWTDDDLPDLLRYAGNKKIADNLMDMFPHPYTQADGLQFLSRVRNDDPAKVFAIDVRGEAVGSIGIFPQTDIHRKNAEMGYWLAEPFWGRGIVTEAVRRMVRYGFETFDINRIFATPFPANIGSQRVLEKAGFRLEARLEKTILKNGEFMDELIYAVRR